MTSTSYAAVDQFEKEIASYCGSKYSVAVDSCCNAIFLCCYYKKVQIVEIPKNTYPGVASAIIHAGGKINFRSNDYWSAENYYALYPYDIIDSALNISPDIHIKNRFTCLSFHAKKQLPIGRGGMILTDDKKAYEWFKIARFDGRNPVPLIKDHIKFAGWNFYMTPEQASRGLMLFEIFKNNPNNSLNWNKQGYPDLSIMEAYERHKA